MKILLSWQRPLTPILERLAAADGVGPVALVKVLVFFGRAGHDVELYRSQAAPVVEAMYRARGSPTLLELRTLLEPMGTPRHRSSSPIAGR